MRAERIELEGDEQVLLRVRKHWFMLCAEALLIVFFATIPAVLILIVDSKIEVIREQIHVNTPYLISLYTGWLILLWMAIFNVWTNYYLDVWTLTDRRLIAIDQRGYFSRTTSSFRLDRMQDITVEIHGLLPTFLDYGTLEIQTAGSVEERFKVHGMPEPERIKSTVLKAIETLHRGTPTRFVDEV